MAQRIITLCDVHARSDEDKAGATWEVTLTGPGLKATTWEVDLCADDGKGLEDLATMLDEVGRVTHGKRAKAPTAARNGARTAWARGPMATMRARPRWAVLWAGGRYSQTSPEQSRSAVRMAHSSPDLIPVSHWTRLIAPTIRDR